MMMKMNNSDVTVNEQEDSFSKFYASELRKKRQQINNNDRGFNELEDERRQVFQQAIRTPGRRGEVIKKKMKRNLQDDSKQVIRHTTGRMIEFIFIPSF